MKYLALTTFAAAALLTTTTASAQSIYGGTANGSPIGGPQDQPDNQNAKFLDEASGYGAVTTLTFDAAANSDAALFTFPGVTIASTGSGYGNGYTGVSSTTFGNLYGYDISAGGSGKWFGFVDGTATFTFAAPTNSFGFYTTGTQTTFGNDLLITINGVTYNGLVNADGGATFFGYVSATPFLTATISRPGFDAWGIDSVSFNGAPSVPEPGTWLMMIAGFGLAGVAMRRRSTKIAFA